MDGHDYAVMYDYKGKVMSIANVKAMTDRKALNLARKIYGDKVWVRRDGKDIK